VLNILFYKAAKSRKEVFMKKNRFWGIVAVAAVTAIFLISCKGFGQTAIGANGKITESNLVGIWKLESVENVSREECSSSVEYFEDGTGLAYHEQFKQLYGAGMPFKWQLRDGNRLQTEMNGMVFIHDIDLSENGTLLTTYIDGRNFEGENPRKATERKIKKQ
jgi:hypothetical protein